MRNLVLVFLAVSAVAEPLAAQRSRAAGRRALHPLTWTAPSCETVFGLPTFRFIRLDESFTATNAVPHVINQYAPFTTSDVPNRLFAIFDGSVRRSDDAGCHWWRLGAAPPNLTRLTPAPGGEAYAWGYHDVTAVRITTASIDLITFPEPVMGFAVDPADADHLRAVGRSGGTSYESFDGGATWQQRGEFGPYRIYAVAVDPSDFRRITVSAAGMVGHSRDGGATWTPTELANIFELAVSPTDGNVIWAAGVIPGRQRTLWRSDDGALSFVPITVSGEIVRFTTGPLAPHPTDPAIVAFPTKDGLVIADARAGTVEPIGLRKQWDAIVWSPAAAAIYVAAPDVSIDIN